MSQNQSASIVKLSVGGVRFETTQTTLTADKNSILAAMFSGRWTLPTTDDGYHLIDRDGSVFGYILNHLRGSIVLPSDRETMDRLTEEANYFNLSGLLSAIKNHDMNSREIVIVYMEKRFEFRIDQLRKERASTLAVAATSLHNKFNESGLLVLNLIPCHDEEQFPSCHLDRNRVIDMDAFNRRYNDFLLSWKLRSQLESIATGADFLFGEYWKFSSIKAFFYGGLQCRQCSKSHEGNKHAQLLMRCALIAIENYMNNSRVSLDTILEMEITRTYPFNEYQMRNSSNYLTLTQLLEKVRDQQTVQKIIRPAVCEVAKYFKLFKFADTLEKDQSAQ